MQQFVGTPSCYPQLVELRKSKTAAFKQNKYLKETTKLRYYQVVGSLHMLMLDRMVLGDATGIGKCVSEDTYINTTFGLIKIKDLIKDYMTDDHFYPVPDYINLLSINKICKPSALYISGVKKGLRITSQKGFDIDGLNHHPILVSGDGHTEFKKLSDLKIGDYICINRNGLFSSMYVNSYFKEDLLSSLYINSKKYDVPGYVNEDLAELMGYFISEGSSCKNSGFQITQFEKEINSRIRYLLKKCFGYEENALAKSFDKEVKISSVHIVKYLEKLGIIIQAKSVEKKIPWSILQSPKIIIKAFLRGYFEGDGSVELSNRIVSCSSKSEELIKQVQLLLLNFGMVPRRRRKLVKVKNERRPYWIMYLCGKNVDIFKKEIGFVSLRKNVSLDHITRVGRNTNLDIIPFGGKLIKDSMKDIIEHLRTVPEHKNFSVKGSGWKGIVGLGYKHVLESAMYGQRKLTYEKLKSFIDIIESEDMASHIKNYSLLKEVYNQNIFFDKVVKIEECEKLFVDFHVPETHNFTGNGFINHNTLQSIAAHTWLLEKNPNTRVLVVTNKSAASQWQEEYEKFTNGITVRVIMNEYKDLTGYNARKLQYEEFKEHVMVVGYATIRNEYEAIRQALGNNDYTIFFDECVAFKNRKSETYFAASYLSEYAKRVYGLSATIIKNGLEEVYGIYSVIVPGLFGKITRFKDTYCQQKMMKLVIGGKTRMIPKITGYKNLNQFKQVLDPYFLIRRKEEVATELPKLISRKVVLEMYPEQKELYRQALAGIIYEEKVKQEFFEIADKVRTSTATEKDMELYKVRKEKYDKFSTEEGKKRGKLAALTYCQMISNGPSLVNQPGDSSKDDEFLRLMKEELLTEKVILYTRFASGIPTLEVICERNHITYVKITGADSDDDRIRARHRFQNDPTCNLIFITNAGSASLNLQSAGCIIFFDTPWSYGDLVQTIGRAQRIGSIKEHILLLHLVNKGSIDMRVINKVTDKKELSDQILGDTSVGALDFASKEESVFDDLYSGIIEDAKNG